MKTKIFVLLFALCLLLTGCGKSEAVLTVEEQIAAIGTVSLQSIESIERAEVAYAALSAEDKEDVSNYDFLEKARLEYDELVKQRNQEQISAVEGMIDNLENVTWDKKGDVEAARKAFSELETSLQEKVANVQILLDAEEYFSQLDAVTVDIPYYDLVKEVLYSSEYNYVNTYDANGRLIKRESSGDSKYVKTYEYDENGRLVRDVEESLYYSSKGAKDIYTYTYNEKGLVATCTETELKADGTPGYRDGNFWTYTYEFDSDGRVVKEVSDNDGYVSINTYEYDDMGRISKQVETTYPDGYPGRISGQYEVIPTYDDAGNKIHEKVRDLKDGGTWSNSWTYEMKYIPLSAKTGELQEAKNWKGFAEAASFPTPNSCLSNVSFEAQADGVYSYVLPDSAEQAQRLFAGYLQIMSKHCHCVIKENAGKTIAICDNVTLEMSFSQTEQGNYLEIMFLSK